MTNTFRAFLFALVCLCSTSFLRAATFTVTRFDDTAAVSGGIPGTGAGAAGDLRTAILAANIAGGAGNTILFSCGAGPCTITLNGPLPPITSNLTIDGGTLGTIIIDGNSLYRVFFVDAGAVTLAHLQIQNALAQGGNGGLAQLACGGGGAGLGGGLFVNGVAATVTVTEVFFLNDAAVGGNGCAVGGTGDGGGGGGLGGNGGNGGIVTSGVQSGDLTNGGGGGVLSPGVNGTTTSTDGSAGGLGGGGGTDQNGDPGATPGTGGPGYASNSAGAIGALAAAGDGGFGGGGGAGVQVGGNGGFGGGGGGSELTGGNGGAGGGGGAGRFFGSGTGGSLGGSVAGGAGSDVNGINAGSGGGGAAAGPAIFVNEGTLVTIDSAAAGSSAMGGLGGTGAGNGGANSTPVFNFSGMVNSSNTTGPIAGALGSAVVSVLSFSTPATATSSVAFTFTVTAKNQSNSTDTSYTGTIHFTSSDGSAVLPADSTLTNGVGTFSVTLKTDGNQTITATDTATSAITGTSGAIAVSAAIAPPPPPPPPPPPAITTLTLRSSLNPSALGQAVTFTVLIGTSGGPFPADPPTGNVQFFDGNNSLASVTLLNAQASYTTSTLSGGNHTIVAEYSGDSTWPSTQANYRQTVNAPLTLTLATSPASLVYGQAVTLTANIAATVPSGFAMPSGQVAFGLARANRFSPPLPLGATALVSGAATLQVNSLAVGTNTIVAQYSGDATWSPVTATINVVISPASTSVNISMAPVSGQVVLSSAVAPVAPGAGTPTGSIQFVDTSSKTTIASANLSEAKSSATLSAVVAATALGRPIAAVYSGDGNFKGSASTPLPSVANAAAGLSGNLSGDEIASVFGIVGLSGDTSATLPLQNSLAGVNVSLTDSAGAAWPALLYGVFSSTGQVNFIVPGGAAQGLGMLTITVAGSPNFNTAIEIAGTAPGIFTANQTGQGVYAGQIVYVHADGSQTVVSSAAPDSAGMFVPTPVILSTPLSTPLNTPLNTPGDQAYLVLYGTGIRHAGKLTATLNGVNIPVTYFGDQASFPGLDQINLGPLPASLAGAGSANLAITADGQAANTVTVTIQ